MFTIVLANSASDNDQVKKVRKDYTNVKPVWPVYLYVATNVNVNLMLIFIELY